MKIDKNTVIDKVLSELMEEFARRLHISFKELEDFPLHSTNKEHEDYMEISREILEKKDIDREELMNFMIQIFDIFNGEDARNWLACFMCFLNLNSERPDAVEHFTPEVFKMLEKTKQDVMEKIALLEKKER